MTYTNFFAFFCVATMVRVLFCPHLGYERYIFGVKVQNYLHISEKSSTFAGAKKSFDEPMPAVGIIPKSRVVVWLGLWTILWSL